MNSSAPRDAAPAGISKYNGCNREELLKKIQDIREQQSILDKKKNAVPGHPIKLPKNEKLQMRAHIRELQELGRVLKGLDTAVDGQSSSAAPLMPASAADDQIGDDESANDAAAGEAVAFSSSDVE
jgi:hypothetical protein